MRKSIIVLGAIFLALTTGAQTTGTTGTTGTMEKGKRVAVCEITPLQNSQASGTVTFTETPGGIRVVADITGLSTGVHGFHIHEKGDCSAPDGSTAGGHFNPGKHQHGDREDQMRHTGDMGNLEADATGKAHLEYVDKLMTFDGENSIIGLSVIVHEKADDLKSQPTGNSGGRIGCGIIVIR